MARPGGRIVVASALTIVGAYASAANLNVKELMTGVVEPASNAVFYVSRDPPQSDSQWLALQQHAGQLVAAAKSLSKAELAKDKQWQADLKLLIDAASAADKAAKSKNQAALEELNDPLYTACTTCHEHYLPKR